MTKPTPPTPDEGPTPRTDAAILPFETFYQSGDGPTRFLDAVPMDFARRLERELAALQAWPDTLQGWGLTPAIVEHWIKGQQERIHATQDIEKELAARDARIAADAKRIEELEADADRYRWLRENINGSFGPVATTQNPTPMHHWSFTAPAYENDDGLDLDAAIDAARSPVPQPTEGEKG